MLRYAGAIIIGIHGIIHILGFVKAFEWTAVSQIARTISKPTGLCWLLAAILLVAAALLCLLKISIWWLPALVGALLSQWLIVPHWQDARYGTVPNVIILLAALLAWGSWRFEKQFRKDAKAIVALNLTKNLSLITEADLAPLPVPVQRYLHFAGVVGKPRVHSMKVIFEGEMRERGKDWFPFHTVQYNRFDEPSRLFFMKAKMFGMEVPGYHRYAQAKASMNIRLFGLFPLVRHASPQLDLAETVTVFNDMCLLAPATLIDPRIQWQPVDNHAVKAIFTNHHLSCTAVLYIDDAGKLINFVSDDRYAIADNRQYRFSTPCTDYKVTAGGYRLFHHGEAVWHYPEGKFTYGIFRLQEVVYNPETIP